MIFLGGTTILTKSLKLFRGNTFKMKHLKKLKFIHFIIDLPPTKIKIGEVINAILIIVDRYTKFAKYFVVKIIIMAVKLVDLFFK